MGRTNARELDHIEVQRYETSCVLSFSPTLTKELSGGLFRVILNNDGSALHHHAPTPFEISEDGGLDIVQGPSGFLYTVKYKGGKIRFLKPIEEPSVDMAIKSVFPRRGSQNGGSVLRIYGDNLGSATSVRVGNEPCPLLVASIFKIECILLGGNGTVDITVSGSNQTATFRNGYRFISGTEIAQASLAPSATIESSSPSAVPVTSRPKGGKVVARVNCGGMSLIDKHGNNWISDDLFHHGSSRVVQTESKISRTKNMELYQVARSFRRNGAGPYYYDIPVPAVGYYRVVLGFAEIEEWRGDVGDRETSISIEGRTKLEAFDIVLASGAAFTRIRVPLGPILVLDGNLTVAFDVVKFNPLISTIKVFALDKSSNSEAEDAKL